MPGTGLAIPDVAGRSRRVAVAAAFDFTTGVLPSGAALTRASTGTRCGVGGAVETAGVDSARFDYDPVSHALRGLLIEPAATNGLPYAEQFDGTGGWAALNGTVSGNAAAGPDGAVAADLFVASTANAAHRLLPVTAGFTAGTSYVASCFFKAAGYRYASIRLPAAPYSAGNRFAVFDLQTGAVSSASAGLIATIEPAAAGFYRCQAAATPAVTASGQTGLAVSQTGVIDATEAFAGDGVSGVLAWGAQLEIGAAASSYIATGAASASRAADALVLDWGGRGIADGAITVRYTFDDDSTQDVTATIAGGTAAVSTTLNRARLRRAERV